MSKPRAQQQDPLTGLYCRRDFLDVFSTAIAAAGEKNLPLSLALLDIDDFLKINNSFGHNGGDVVLMGVAGVIAEQLPETATAARYGGDEFAILLPETEREQAFLAVERIRAIIEGIEIQSGEKTVAGIRISGGVASYPIDGNSEAELLRKADQALYRAKVAGRNRIRLAYEEKMVPKTSHYTQTQLERLSKLAQKEGLGEAELLREALDGLLLKYGVNEIES